MSFTTTVPPRPVYTPDSPLDYAEPLVAGEVVLDEVIAPRASWSAIVKAGNVFTLVDVGGNQSGDCLIFAADDTAERYSVPDTLAWQGNAYLDTGSVLRSNRGRPLMTIVANEIERQDTIGGACSQESNTLRYGHHTAYQHACRENFLYEGAKWGLSARDLVSNINWYMNVPVEEDGSLGIVDGTSAPGRRVACRAERDVIVVISNCPQMNNPCNDFNVTPLRALVTRPETAR